MSVSIPDFLFALLRLVHRQPIVIFLSTAALAAGLLSEVRAEPARHAIAMHGEPAMREDFEQLPYANPSAPKGGRLVQGILGTFDSLNPFIVKGVPATGVRGPLVSGSNAITGYIVESLMARGYDEPFTLYGLLARTVETDEARSYVTFTLDPAARVSDVMPGAATDIPSPSAPP